MEVFRHAQTADSAYAAARATWAASQERIPQARAGLLPLASLSASAQYADRDTRFRDDITPRTSAGAGSTALSLTVTQPLYRRQNNVVYQQALTQVEQADAQLALAGQDLILRTAQAYFDVLLASDNVAFAEAQRTAIAEQLQQAKRNFDVGTTTITDVHEAQARHDLTTAQEIAARNDLELRRRALEQIIGRAAPPLAPLGPRFTLKSPEPARMETWVELAEQANLQVRIAQSALEFAAHEIDRNRAAHLPTLDAFATLSSSGANRDTTGAPGSDVRSSAIGVQLAVPLYQGGAISSRVREAIANQGRAGDELASARRSAAFSARQAYLGITSGIAQVRALEAALVSTQSQLDSTRLGRDVGVRTQVDVLNAQQLIFSAQRDFAQAKYTYVMSLLRLEAAIAELTEADLAAVNDWLDRDPAAAGRAAAPVPAATPTVQTAPIARPAKAPALPVEISKPAPAASDMQSVVRTIEAWARAWSSNDVAGYLAFYDADFKPPRGLSREAWEAERTARVQKPRRIEVKIESPAVTFDKTGRATATFRQHYRSGPLDLSSEKVLTFVRRNEQWLIEHERVDSETRR